MIIKNFYSNIKNVILKYLYFDFLQQNIFKENHCISLSPSLSVFKILKIFWQILLQKFKVLNKFWKQQAL